MEGKKKVFIPILKHIIQYGKKPWFKKSDPQIASQKNCHCSAYFIKQEGRWTPK